MEEKKMKEMMGWSQRQGEMVSGGGRIVSLWKDYNEEDLPHFLKMNGLCSSTFTKWAKEKEGESEEKKKVREGVVGSWNRHIFAGGWTYSDHLSGEDVFNVVTNTLFIDIRIPKFSSKMFSHHRSFDTFSIEDLRLFARRHAFGGFGAIDMNNAKSPGAGVCTRHHWIDWNFVGKMRPRPNQWRIELNNDSSKWKEWSIVKDSFDQHLYMEMWVKMNNATGRRIAMYKDNEGQGRAALLVISGNYFNFIEDRDVDLRNGKAGNLCGLIDQAAKQNDRSTLLSYLSLTAHHGQIHPSAPSSPPSPWVIHRSLHPWKENTTLFQKGDIHVKMNGRGGVGGGVGVWEGKEEEVEVMWGGEKWVVLECSEGVEELRKLFLCGAGL